MNNYLLDKIITYNFHQKTLTEIPSLLVNLSALDKEEKCEYLSLNHLKANVIAQLNKLPQCLLEKFQDEGWKIIITDEIGYLEKKYNFSYEVYGCTDYENKQIYVYAYNLAIKYSLIHEIAHFIDNYLGKISESKEWKYIQNLHSHWNYKYYFTDNDKENPCEFFANCVSLYFNNEKELKRIDKQAYDFIYNLFENINYLIEIKLSDYNMNEYNPYF